jgi:hypothetical protein
MVVGKKYTMNRLESKITTYGPGVLADIGENIVWLPRKYLEAFPKEAIEDYNKNYRGYLYMERDSEGFINITKF